MNNNIGSVCCVGSINVDFCFNVDNFPMTGETVHGTFNRHFGGKGANLAVMVHLLSRRSDFPPCIFVSCVGDDSFGQEYLTHLRDDIGIQYDIEVQPRCPTGMASLTINSKGENKIIVVDGANGLISASLLRNKQSVLNCSIIATQVEMPVESVIFLVSSCLELNRTSVLNLSAFRPSDWSKDNLLNVLHQVSVLVVNEVELTQLHQFIQDSAVDIHQSQAMLEVHRIMCQSPRHGIFPLLIVTLGRSGSIVAYSSSSSSCLMEIQVPQVAMPLDCDVVDTVGAGDAFLGSLVYFMAIYERDCCHCGIQSSSVLIADFVGMMRKSHVVASSTVKKFGAQSSYPRYNDLNDLFQLINQV